MNQRLSLLFGLCIVVGTAPVVSAHDAAVTVAAPSRPCPHCPQDEISFREVISHRCKIVPDTKQIKKTVYECKEVPFCLHKLPKLFSHVRHDCCEDCPECDCPRYKKVLLKKEIVCEEICGTKCVIEEVVERVPCRVCRPTCPSCTTGTSGPPLGLTENPAPIPLRISDDFETLLVPPPPVPAVSP